MSKPQALCPSCGSAAKSKDRFCLVCGAAMPVEAPPAPPPPAPRLDIRASRPAEAAPDRPKPAARPSAELDVASWPSREAPPPPPPTLYATPVAPAARPLATPVIAPSVQPPLRTETAPNRKRRIAIMVGIPVMVVAIVAAAVVTYMRVYSFNARIDKALTANQLFSPPGSSVADIYAAKKASSPNSADLQAAGAKIRRKLWPIGDELLRKWYVDSEGVDWDYTEKVYGFLQEVAPSDPAIKVRHDYVMAQIKLQNRDYATALTLYQQSLAGDPKFVLALNGIAKVYIQDGSPLKNEPLAVDYYGRVIQTDPNFTWAYKNISEYFMRKDDWPNAEAYMLRALATSPQRPSILRSLARIYFNMSRWPEALAYNERYLRVATDPDGISKAQAAVQQIRQKLGR